MSSLRRLIMIAVALPVAFLGASDIASRESEMSCYACASGCGSGLIAACWSQCSDRHFPDGCASSSICAEYGGHKVDCFVIE